MDAYCLLKAFYLLERGSLGLEVFCVMDAYCLLKAIINPLCLDLRHNGLMMALQLPSASMAEQIKAKAL